MFFQNRNIEFYRNARKQRKIERERELKRVGGELTAIGEHHGVVSLLRVLGIRYIHVIHCEVSKVEIIEGRKN